MSFKINTEEDLHERFKVLKTLRLFKYGSTIPKGMDATKIREGQWRILEKEIQAAINIGDNSFEMSDYWETIKEDRKKGFLEEFEEQQRDSRDFRR